MARTVFIVLLLIATLVPCGARAVDIRYEVGVFSAYVWRGITLTDDPVLQPAIRLDHANGLSVSGWANADLGDANDNEFEVNEVRWTVDYTRDLGPLDLGVGLVEYLFPNTPFPGTREVYLRLARPGTIAPRFTVFYDFDAIDGVYAELGSTYRRVLRGPWAVSADLAVGYADERFAIGRQAGFHDGRLTLGLEREGPRYSWRLSAGWSESLDEDVLFDQPVAAWTGISVGRKF